MRGAIVAVVLVLVAAAVAVWALDPFGDGGAVTPLRDGDLPDSTRARADDPPASGPAASSPALGDGVVARRIAAKAEAMPAPPLADAPTAWLRVVDRNGERPIAGAPIRRVQDGGELGFTDERGLAPVPLRDPEQLAVLVDGFLLRQVPTRLGTTEAEPQLVQLVRDEWSIVRRIAFDTPRGSPAGDVFVRFRPKTASKRGPAPVPAGDVVAQRAWTEHTMLAGLPVAADVPVQLGSWNEDRVHRLASDTDVRFLTPGEFTLEAASVDGLTAQLAVRIDAAPRTGAPPIRVKLVPGAFVEGRVSSVQGPAIAGAKITLEGGDPLALEATSGADGAFALGPLSPRHGATVHVRHPDYTPQARGPIEVPSSGSDILLAPLPATTLRGRVRARPGGQPLANATVAWHPAGSAPVATTTGADGTFQLAATGTADSRLAIQALGYVPYAELLAPGAPFLDFDLWPATTADRLQHGLSALLEGIVVDAQGRPVAGVELRWQPAQRVPPLAAVTGRRVLEGASLDLPLGARTGDDGAFRLETNAFGAGKLALADGNAALDVTATAGQTVNGLRLQR